MVIEKRGQGRDGLEYTAECEFCGHKETGFYGVSNFIYKTVKEHENNCKLKR